MSKKIPENDHPLKHSMIGPLTSIDPKTVKLPITKKYARQSKVKRKAALAEILDQDPRIKVTVLAKRMRLKRVTVQKYIFELRREGHAGAIERHRIYKEWREVAATRRQRILDYYEKYPYSRVEDVAKDLDIEIKHINTDLRYLKKKYPGEIKMAKGSMSKAVTKLMISEYYQANPTATYSQVCKALCLSNKTVAICVQELTEEVKTTAVEKYGVYSDFYVEQVMKAIEQCETKFVGCRAATHGARWIELKLMALKMFAKKYGLEQPDVTVNVNVEVGKEERDAVADALAKTMHMAKQMELVEPTKVIEHKPDDVIDAEFKCKSDEFIEDEIA